MPYSILSQSPYIRTYNVLCNIECIIRGLLLTPYLTSEMLYFAVSVSIRMFMQYKLNDLYYLHCYEVHT